MPECPKCGAEINYLINYCKKPVCFTFEVNERGYPVYHLDSEAEDYVDDEFVCPECEEVLFTDEKDAIEFLKPKQQKQATLVGGEITGRK